MQKKKQGDSSFRILLPHITVVVPYFAQILLVYQMESYVKDPFPHLKNAQAIEIKTGGVVKRSLFLELELKVRFLIAEYPQCVLRCDAWQWSS